ncbi:hypothetical protein EPN52_08550 [bacterium]|nr:MAG: hypothetical protein EPN52_08550 [bacterium]
MRGAMTVTALAALLTVTGAAIAGQATGKHTTSEAARPSCLPGAQGEGLLSPRARRAEAELLKVRLLLLREEELTRLRRSVEARIQAREAQRGAQQSDRVLNLP